MGSINISQSFPLLNITGDLTIIKNTELYSLFLSGIDQISVSIGKNPILDLYIESSSLIDLSIWETLTRRIDIISQYISNIRIENNRILQEIITNDIITVDKITLLNNPKLEMINY